MLWEKMGEKKAANKTRVEMNRTVRHGHLPWQYNKMKEKGWQRKWTKKKHQNIQFAPTTNSTEVAYSQTEGINDDGSRQTASGAGSGAHGIEHPNEMHQHEPRPAQAHPSRRE